MWPSTQCLTCMEVSFHQEVAKVSINPWVFFAKKGELAAGKRRINWIKEPWTWLNLDTNSDNKDCKYGGKFQHGISRLTTSSTPVQKKGRLGEVVHVGWKLWNPQFASILFKVSKHFLTQQTVSNYIPDCTTNIENRSSNLQNFYPVTDQVFGIWLRWTTIPVQDHVSSC